MFDPDSDIHDLKCMGYCWKCCRSVNYHLLQIICQNGSRLVYWACEKCGKRQDKKFIPHESVRRMGVDIEKIPIQSDYRGVECEVVGCKDIETEEHHWAPRSIFGKESYSWPVSMLCKKHHSRWHRVMAQDGVPGSGGDLGEVSQNGDHSQPSGSGTGTPLITAE